MSEGKTISINGRAYDARSGLAVDTSDLPATTPATPVAPATPAPSLAASPARRSVTATTVHSSTQRSHTLNRRTITKPTPAAPVVKAHPRHQVIKHKPPVAAPHQPSTALISGQVKKFAPRPVTPRQTRVMDIAPATQHPLVAKAEAHTINKVRHEAPLPVAAPVRRTPHHAATAHQTSVATEAVSHASSDDHAPKRHHILKRHPRALSIAAATFGVVLLGGYLTYINLPSLSVRVASAQAGISANYPNYQPDGYSLSGLVGYAPGEVSMKFASNSGPQAFTIKQIKSNWDSSAVLDNYVAPRAGVSYIPYTERGLTIYTYGTNAAWVNGGVLYTIEGDAPLSSDQIRHIATSLI